MKVLKILFAAAATAALLPACAPKNSAPELTESGLNPENFKTDSTALYVLKNASGMEVCVTNYGGRIVSVSVPDRDGNMRDVVLGFDSVQAYYPENNARDRKSVV